MNSKKNFINGQWVDSSAVQKLSVINPATAQTIAEIPVTPAGEVDEVVQRAHQAFEGWMRTPVTERIQFLFKLKNLFEENIEDLAHAITEECGKTKSEAIGELRRGIENIEVACGAPILMQGYNNEDIASGIDEHMIRQPLGVVVAITPFNFPGMIPFWFLPYAIACGNSFILKPSQKLGLTAHKIFALLEKTGLPAGVVQLVQGNKETVDALIDHTLVSAVSFVGSTEVAKYIYGRATANGKRAQCQGGAKNPIIVLPDADIEMTTQMAADSFYGCAGQRCLAGSVAITVGDKGNEFKDAIIDVARNRKVGYGWDEGIEMGPVISAESKSRIENFIDLGAKEGAKIVVDGRGAKISGYENGNFILPTVLDEVDPHGEIAKTEIFGPVLSLINAKDIEEAIALINSNRYGNMACLFTSSGAAARKFRHECIVGNIGINIGVAAPMAFYPFSGWKDSFFGDLHAQGRHGVEFYTQTKVVVERWPKEWSRKF